MFSFDGSYRRTPVQSLGGASRNSDRDTLIRKAQEERHKRAELRRQINGATVIQSYARSFIIRQRVKGAQRRLFDDDVQRQRQANSANALSDSGSSTLELMLRRILFFYYEHSRADGERLIALGQFIVRAPAFLLEQALHDRTWRLRLQRLLQLCTQQICHQTQLAQTIPFRLLETFTTAERVLQHVRRGAPQPNPPPASNNDTTTPPPPAPEDPADATQDERKVRDFLHAIFAHLVRGNYFRLLRRMLDEKVPPLDGAVTAPPNALSETLLQMLLQPLRLIVDGDDSATHAEALNEGSRLILGSFVEHILEPAYTDAVRLFVLPCLVLPNARFPYAQLIRYLDSTANHPVRSSGSASAAAPADASAAMDYNYDTTTTASSATAATTVTDAALPPPAPPKLFHPLDTAKPFLLHALLALDVPHQQRLFGSVTLLAAYIRCIATMTAHLPRLPAGKRVQRAAARAMLLATARAAACDASTEAMDTLDGGSAYDNDNSSDDDSDDDDDDDDDDTADGADEVQAMPLRSLNVQLVRKNRAWKLTALETDVLLAVVVQLNEPPRTKLIAGRVEQWFLSDAAALHAVCQICHNLMLHNRLADRDYPLLSALYFKPKFIRIMWLQLTTQSSQLRFSSPLSLLSRGVHIPHDDIRSVIPLLATFCNMFDQLIQTLHDGEFCQDDILPGAVSKIMPFTLAEIATISSALKDIALGLVDLAFPETRQNVNDHYRSVRCVQPRMAQIDETRQWIMWPHLLKVCVSLLRQLYTRDLRRSFCAPDHWTVDTLNLPLDKPDDLHLSSGRRHHRSPRPFQPIKDFTKEDFEFGGPPLSTKQIRSITILREIPFVVPFNTRVNILQGLLSADRLQNQGDLQGFLQGPSISLTVRRSHLYEDAFDKLCVVKEPDMRPRFRVQMINNIGLEEVGIDGGGVFREFLSELIKTAFDPNRGLFMITTDNKLYPNPAVGVIHPNFQQHYFFIGRMLGKALYENLLVELPLADFFLSKLAGRKSTVDVHQLASLDPVLHHNLLGLKSYEEGDDVEELGLDFTVISNELGGTRVEELIPNGANVPVTNANRMEYIRLMADYKLNAQMKQQCASFRRGLANVVPVEWLHMFSNKEFQVLISGAEIPVDVDDLEVNTKYGGDFGPEHRTIRHFWNVVHGFDDLQRRQLLKFVTSCSRPPLLGFKDLDPPFCIQNSGDTDRLPSASTCMNLLKLPAFTTAELLREKLLYAIESGSGFELS